MVAALTETAGDSVVSGNGLSIKPLFVDGEAVAAELPRARTAYTTKPAMIIMPIIAQIMLDDESFIWPLRLY